MTATFRNRLASIEARLSENGGHNNVVFIPLPGETNEDCKSRMLRWMNGEVVEGISQPFSDECMMVARIKFVSACR